MSCVTIKSSTRRWGLEAKHTWKLMNRGICCGFLHRSHRFVRSLPWIFSSMLLRLHGCARRPSPAMPAAMDLVDSLAGTLLPVLAAARHGCARRRSRCRCTRTCHGFPAIIVTDVVLSQPINPAPNPPPAAKDGEYAWRHRSNEHGINREDEPDSYHFTGFSPIQG